MTGFAKIFGKLKIYLSKNCGNWKNFKRKNLMHKIKHNSKFGKTLNFKKNNKETSFKQTALTYEAVKNLLQNLKNNMFHI